MSRVDPATLGPGDRVYRYWDAYPTAGLNGPNDRMKIQELTVVRVNPKTVTVRTDYGSEFRINPGDIAGRVDWESVDRSALAKVVSAGLDAAAAEGHDHFATVKAGDAVVGHIVREVARWLEDD
ncbi:MAG: hypothetical protein ACRBK7_14445 [Acidimicrobiales bacterium]